MSEDNTIPEELEAALAESRNRLGEAPADMVVANHAMGLYELAAIHLTAQPPRLPQAALANLDPIFSPSTIITTHAYCVFDTLYGANRALQPRPQMAEGHSVEDDGKLVKIRLREGLRWHDGEPVRAQDCVASIKR